MSGYQVYESTSENGFAPAASPAENPPIIVSMPDLDGNLDAEESDTEESDAEEFGRPSVAAVPSVGRLSRSKISVAIIAVAVVLIGGWIIFGGGSVADQSARESWQHTPPAASATEAPPWNANAESKTIAVKLDEVLPRLAPGKTLPTIFEEAPVKKPYTNKTDEKAVKVVAKPPAADILPRVAANRSLAIETPVPPAKMAAVKQGRSSLSVDEYYWAVRRRSEADKNVPKNAATHRRHGTARLDDVSETRTGRMY